MPENKNNTRTNKPAFQNPGPNALWCERCQAWKQFGIAKVHGQKASDAHYTIHCPAKDCNGILNRNKPGGGF